MYRIFLEEYSVFFWGIESEGCFLVFYFYLLLFEFLNIYYFEIIFKKLLNV